ncbi:MAG TPA: solute carrier family 23 protein [Candidatus Acidoferrales bacterium]|jgi:xanthine/uracil permease|nr:solute carrier family 23 protein [Candidatus Acidoferrales bacterium]
MAVNAPIKDAAPREIFDVGINDSLPPGQLLILGLQNVFGMTGMFVFPGLLGRSFNLPSEKIAYLYGMTFAVCGVITVLQSIFLLRLPIIQGPYAGSFAALISVGHLQNGGLGAAFGSFFVASLIWCALTLPVRRFSFIGLFARFLRAPIISGMMVMLVIIQISNVALPNWIGLPSSPGFPVINILAGAVAIALVIGVTLWGGTRLRRGAILAGLAAGTACYAIFRPISFAAVANAPVLVAPLWFPFGFGVRADLVIVFLLVLIPPGMGSMAMYQMVADWGAENLPAERMAQGVFGMAIGSVLAAIVGGLSTIAYPDNIGMLRATRVGSRYATLAAGILLITLGGFIKFDMLLVVVPMPVISATATLLFGIVFMHGVHMLANVDWDERKFMVAGLALLVGLGGLFISPEVLQSMPLMVRLIVQQPVISGGLTLVVLHSILCAIPPANESTRT